MKRERKHSPAESSPPLPGAWRRILKLPVALLAAVALQLTAGAQLLPDAKTQDSKDSKEVPEIPERVDVTPVAGDMDIATRLEQILEASEWFENPGVETNEGIVFLTGSTAKDEYKEWAQKLARNTEGVVAVVNRISVRERSIWDFSETWQELVNVARSGARLLPLAVVGLFFLFLVYYATRGTRKISDSLLRRYFKTSLLRQVIANAIALPVFMIGLYVILRVAGLTQLAITVIGSTGLLGLVLGFAFRDIAENFLASILISMQPPFQIGDRILVVGHTGFVQRVTARGTLLMTLDGNHVQIPNSIIYKESIVNFTANPLVRQDFNVGIGYADSIGNAQAVAMKVMQEHPAWWMIRSQWCWWRGWARQR